MSQISLVIPITRTVRTKVYLTIYRRDRHYASDATSKSIIALLADEFATDTASESCFETLAEMIVCKAVDNRVYHRVE